MRKRNGFFPDFFWGVVFDFNLNFKRARQFLNRIKLNNISQNVGCCVSVVRNRSNIGLVLSVDEIDMHFKTRNS